MLDAPKKIILFEQDLARRNSLKTILSREGYRVFSFDAIAGCLDNMDLLDADLMIVGGLEGRKAIPMLNALAAIQSRLPLLFISREDNLRYLLELNQCDYGAIVDSPFDLKVFRNAVQSALENGNRPGEMHFASFLVGSSPALIEIKGKLAELGRLNESVMIVGEPGAGKEAVARAIHNASRRDTACFIKINAPELKGARDFSLVSTLKNGVPHLLPGADVPANGKSDQWTVYLNEIGELPKHLQAELLLITGADNHRIRILAGTSRGMAGRIKTGRFRKDLFYRLNVFQVEVPPLRQRRSDIPLLTDFFSYKFCREFAKVCLPVSDRLKSMFLQYHWPGNVRELQEVVKRALVKGEGDVILPNLRPESRPTRQPGEKRPTRLNRSRNMWARELDAIEQMTRRKGYLGQVGEVDMRGICGDFTAKVEKKVMKRALESTNWNRKKAAAMLDISYKSMLNKIKHYGLA